MATCKYCGREGQIYVDGEYCTDGESCHELIAKELAAVRAELEREKAGRICEVYECGKPATTCSSCVEATEKERDKARTELDRQKLLMKEANAKLVENSKSWQVVNATVAVLAAALKYPALENGIIRDLLANLPVAAQSLLREVEALRGVEKAAREHNCGGVWTSACQHVLAALDAVEAGRKG